MKIAVPFENGQIFQHFGHTGQFKVYDVENGAVVSSEILGSNGSGHGALAALLAGRGIDILICGGIGGGAQAALSERGIELCAGASGSADEAVGAYLRGELVDTGAEELAVGEQVYLQNMYVQPFQAKVAARSEDTVTFDANHEMAGKELNFTIELVEAEELPL